MTVYVAFLRAVNVGGYGKLKMRDLAELAENCGFGSVKTYIQSGNVALTSPRSAQAVRSALETSLKHFTGAHVPVFVRTLEELQGVLTACPFKDVAGNRVGIVFAESVNPSVVEMLGASDEEVVFGSGAVFIHYPNGMGKSRLKLKGLSSETMRNRNTVEKLAALADDLGRQP